MVNLHTNGVHPSSDLDSFHSRKSISRKRAGKRGSTAAGSRASANVNVPEINTQRRYLKSPFFCLCQNPSAATASEALPSQPNTSAPGAAGAASNSDSSFHPAHVINPAVITDSTIDCPILRSLNGGGGTQKLSTWADKSSSSELQAFFTSSHYKPALRPGASSRDTRLPEGYSEAACPSWRCVFCAEPPAFLRLGALYGPYFLSSATQARFAPPPSPSLRLIIKAIPPPAGGSISVHNVPQSSPVTSPVKKKLTKGKKVGGSAKSAEEECGGSAGASIPNVLDVQKRIGREGEVWTHLECVFWAPGTHILGDGRIGGLDDAVTMALETVSSDLGLFILFIVTVNGPSFGTNWLWNPQEALGEPSYLLCQPDYPSSLIGLSKINSLMLRKKYFSRLFF